MKQVLVWHQGALGDLILSLPAIRSVRRLHPGSVVHLVCRPDLHDIITFNGLADRVTSKDDGGLAALFSGPSAFSAGWMEGYAAAYVFGRTGGALHETIRSHVPAAVHIRTVPPGGLRVPVWRYQLQQVEGSEAASAEDRCALQWPAAPQGPGGGDVICVHPGSGGSGKCWPLDRYLAVMELLAGEGYAFKVLLGPAEEGHVVRSVESDAASQGTRVEVIRDQPLASVAAHLKSCRGYLGNDSGITHLAGALGVPGVAIFGPTDALIWRPWGVSIDTVHPRADCAPCGEGYRECRDRRCMQGITIDRVAAAVRRRCLRASVRGPAPV